MPCWMTGTAWHEQAGGLACLDTAVEQADEQLLILQGARHHCIHSLGWQLLLALTDILNGLCHELKQHPAAKRRVPVLRCQQRRQQGRAHGARMPIRAEQVRRRRNARGSCLHPVLLDPCRQCSCQVCASGAGRSRGQLATAPVV